MTPGTKNSYNSLKSISINNKEYKYYSLKEAEKNGLEGVNKLPKSLKVLLENLLRYEDDLSVNKAQIEAIKDWLKTKKSKTEIAYRPARVLLQDYTGIPAVADLAAMREAVKEKNKDPNTINPLSSVDLVIDHSVQVDKFASSNSLKENVDIEFNRNAERYSFLKWGQQAFNNFRIVPPGTGICHQVNLEYLSKVVWSEKFKEDDYIFPDTLVGTDSHTTMVNGLSVLGWGVGGIEAEAGMLGQPISMLIPEVIGFELTNKLPEGTTATDLVLTVVKMLRDKGVVGKFVEFYGDGLKNLTLADRATIANMAPEYGATCGFFPIDDETLKYLNFSGRDKQTVDIVEAYAKEQGLWASDEIEFTDTVSLDMSKVVPTISGPKRPQDKVLLTDASSNFKKVYEEITKKKEPTSAKVENEDFNLEDGNIVIAAITSCTNTSNPSVLIGAGLLAKKAVELGLKVPWWVKTSFAPGSKVVREYLDKAGLQVFLNKLGFNIVGYGCTTCIGNSGPLDDKVSKDIEKNKLNVCSIISGNRNFEGRIHPLIKSNFLASPPLVIIYALSGRINIDLNNEEIGISKGKKIFLKDLWPSSKEVKLLSEKVLKEELFKKNYKDIFKGDPIWEGIKVKSSSTFNWSLNSTYVKKPPFLENESNKQTDIFNARPLLILGDSITTDHISPAGVIKESSEAGKYLSERQIKNHDFNSFGSRRGNHEVMVRGTFSNLRIKNSMVNRQGGYTKHYPSEVEDEVYNIAKRYSNQNVPLIVVAGKEYGTGSSRDWAAKGTRLLGVRVVLAESFERIHRSNLVGMGVLPLEMSNTSLSDLKLTGDETFNIGNLSDISSKPNQKFNVKINYPNSVKEISVISRIDTEKEVDYFKNDGILPYVFNLIKA